MRTLAWIAVLCLQIGIFTCGMGIDVCQAADAPAHVSNTLNDASHSNAPDDISPIDSTCVAHAAHLFMGLSDYQYGASTTQFAAIRGFASLTLPEILHAIEHPPKPSYS